jgi:hypothetical protein
MELYKIVELNDSGVEKNDLLLVRANCRTQALEKASMYLNNKAIYRTGFYNAIHIKDSYHYINNGLITAKNKYKAIKKFYKNIIE